MRILILGAGTVGTWIADLMCREGHSVTVVDEDPQRTQRIYDELDVRVITGSASQSSVLFQADVIGSDICLAVTGQDETNIIAASMAKAMGVRRSIARVYAPVFRDPSTFDYQGHFMIDRLVSLEHLSATELARNIRNPGSVVVEHFARGALEVKEVRVSEKSDVTGVQLKELGLSKSIRIGSIKREKKMWLAGADDILQAEDRITLIGGRENVEHLADRIERDSRPKLGVVIAGGGETGYHLACALADDRFSVLMMEESSERSEFLARSLPHATVVHADATARHVLEEERVGSADVFVACTGDDENNIVAGVEAREVGARKIMAIVGRPDYGNIVGKLGIDVTVSERDVMAHQVLGYINKGPIVSRTALPGGDILVLEIEVLEGAPCTEHVLANLSLPPECLIAAAIQGEYVSVPGADDRLHVGSSIVMLVHEPQMDEAVEQFKAGG